MDLYDIAILAYLFIGVITCVLLTGSDSAVTLIDFVIIFIWPMAVAFITVTIFVLVIDIFLERLYTRRLRLYRLEQSSQSRGTAYGTYSAWKLADEAKAREFFQQ